MSSSDVRHWFEALVPQNRAAIAIFAVLTWSSMAFVMAWLLGAFRGLSGALGTAFFFVSINVYGVIAGAIVVRRSVGLVGVLDLVEGSPARASLERELGRVPAARQWSVLAISLVLGFAHNLLLIDGDVPPVQWMFGSTIGIARTLGTMLTWVTVTGIVVAFIYNAGVFSRIGREYLAVDLLHPERLYPMGQAALLPVLGLLGTQMLYPLLSLDGATSAGAVVPGFLVTTVSLIFLFVRTVWPVHKRIKAAKTVLVEKLDGQIEWADAPAEQGALNARLGLRGYAQGLPEWPFRMSALARWSFYLLIPPLTWVGAAFIEILIDGALAG